MASGLAPFCINERDKKKTGLRTTIGIKISERLNFSPFSYILMT